MRAIDADRLKYSISLTMDILEKTEYDIATLAVMTAMAETFLEVIDNMPTLDEAYQKVGEDTLKESACK